MNPKLLVTLLHVGTVIKTFRDLEKAIADLAHGNAPLADWIPVLDDIASLVDDGILVFPGVTADQLTQAIVDIKKAVAA